MQRVVRLLAAGQRVQHPFIGIQMVTLAPGALVGDGGGGGGGGGGGAGGGGGLDDVVVGGGGGGGVGALLPPQRGVVVVKVLADSPAAAAGLRVGDVAVALGGQMLWDAAEVQRAVNAAGPGQPLTVTVHRDGHIVVGPAR